MENARKLSVDAEAVRLVDSGRFRILSLDIFDTTVWRTFPAPTDLFYSLGHQLLRDGFLFPFASAASFATERMEAERDARTKPGRNGEATLCEIYESFPVGFLRNGNRQSLVDAELAMERQSTYVDEAIASLIERVIGRGMDIAFVSDTYFDEPYLRSILPGKFRYLFTSCASRRPKVHGLHDLLMKRAGVKPAEILHIGDNYEADFQAPARLGVQTLWRPRLPKPYHEAMLLELPTTRSERGALFSLPTGDAGLAALRAQSVTAEQNWSDAFRSWGSLFLGPLMTGFGKWVGERCRAENIETAFCLMREGRILKQVLQHCSPDLAAHELFVSRYAMIRASIFEGNVSELASYFARPRALSAQELLQPLDIDPAEAGLNADTLIAASSVQQLAERIANKPALRRKAQRASAVMRGNFLRYLEKNFHDLPKRAAVVDLGYSGTIQGHMQAIFDHEKIDCRTHGLYFVTGMNIRKLQAKGSQTEGFMAENGQPLSIAHSFMRSPELIEQCLMCDSGSTMGYDEAGEPILGEQHLPAAQLQEIKRVQDGLLDFALRFSTFKPLQDVPSSAIRQFLEAILVRSITRPVPLELSCFGKWVHDENFGSSKTRKLIEADLDSDYLSHATAHQLASLSSATAYWIFGTAQAQHPLVGEAVRSIFLRKTTPEAFQCPEEERTMYFFWNDGEAHRAESKYTLSNRRTAWSRFTLDVRQSDLLEVGFSVGQLGDVISLSGIVLRLHKAGQPLETLRIPLSDVETFGLEELKGRAGTYLISDVAGFAAPISSVRDFTGRVEVDLLFSQMPMEAPCLS